MRVSFLIHDAYGVGGTIRTVINLAEALSTRHEVEIVSVFRRRTRPLFDIADRVRVISLVNARRNSNDLRHPLAARPSRLVPAEEQYYRKYSELTDKRIGDYLRRTRSDVLIGTRPSLNLLLAELAPDSAVTVAQEHMTHDMMSPELHAHLRRLYSHLDASVSVTEADAAAFRRLLPADLRVLAIPNSVPEPLVPPSDCTSRIVMAAGRLVDWKRFDILVQAFAKVVAERPDWTLRVFGDGSQKQELRKLIEELDLHNHVFLMGRRSPLDPEWAKASIAAASSDTEPFGMTLVEAMRCGLPVVSTACDYGPPEIISHGADGMLVPVGDVKAMAAGLLELINDDERRRRTGRTAWQRAQRYDPSQVVREYEKLFRELAQAKGRRYRPSRRSVAWPAAAGYRRTRSAVARALPNRVRRRLGRGPAPGPVVDCWFAAPGQLVLSPRQAGWKARGAQLECRERTEPRAAGRLVHVALTRKATSPSGVRAVATINQDALGEGLWDLYLVDWAGRRRRVRAGVRDLRSLVAAAEVSAADPVVRVVPYRTISGYLAIRCWSRQPHAEVTAVRYGDDLLIIEGALYGAQFNGTDPTLTMTRQEGDPRSVVVPGTTTDGRMFRFHLPTQELVTARLSRRDRWDLWVAALPEVAPVRLAHLLDDVADKPSVYRYPSLAVTEQTSPEQVEETPEAYLAVTPAYTIDGDLSMTVTDLFEEGS